MPDTRKLTILVDMDDVMEDLLPAWIAVLNKRCGKNVFIGDVTEWNFDNLYPELTSLEIRSVLSDYDVWSMVRPKSGAPEFLKRIMDEGHNVYVVTAAHPDTMPYRWSEVIAEYFPFIKATHIISCYHKQMIRGDVLIDDGPHNLEGGEYFKILMDAPHNRAVDERGIGAVRAKNWQDVYEFIQKLAETEV